MQCRAYEHCYKLHGNEYAWIGFLDFDEYLRWNSKKKIETMFQQYTGDCVLVNWRLFTDNGLTHYDPRPLKERFTEVMPIDKHVKYEDREENTHVKCFIRGGLGEVHFGKNPHSPMKSDNLRCDRNKSLFWTDEGCGLPIGNLTSQLFSNVYLNEFDQFMKRELGCKHYGRYVDDSFVVSCDRQWMLSLVPAIDEFLQNRLGLKLHRGKTHVVDVRQGIEFLGAFIKPYRIYISNKTVARMRQTLRDLNTRDKIHTSFSVNSYLGVLSHSSSFNLRKRIFLNDKVARVVEFDDDLLKSKPKTMKGTIRK